MQRGFQWAGDFYGVVYFKGRLQWRDIFKKSFFLWLELYFWAFIAKLLVNVKLRQKVNILSGFHTYMQNGWAGTLSTLQPRCFRVWAWQWHGALWKHSILDFSYSHPVSGSFLPQLSWDVGRYCLHTRESGTSVACAANIYLYLFLPSLVSLYLLINTSDNP